MCALSLLVLALQKHVFKDLVFLCFKEVFLWPKWIVRNSCILRQQLFLCVSPALLQ